MDSRATTRLLDMNDRAIQLRRFLVEHFDDDELAGLLDDHFPEASEQISSEWGRRKKAHHLVRWLARRGQSRLEALVRIARSRRAEAFVEWESRLTSAAGTSPALEPIVAEGLSAPGGPRAGERLRVFLSYASDDESRVRQLSRDLSEIEVDPWLDVERLVPGQNWQSRITEVVRDAQLILVCLSSRSAHKVGFVQKEIRLALDAAEQQPEDALFLIPLKLEPCTVPRSLRHLQAVSLVEDGGYGKLVSALTLRANEVGARSPGR